MTQNVSLGEKNYFSLMWIPVKNNKFCSITQHSHKLMCQPNTRWSHDTNTRVVQIVPLLFYWDPFFPSLSFILILLSFVLRFYALLSLPFIFAFYHLRVLSVPLCCLLTISDNIFQFSFDTVTLNSTASYRDYPDDLSHGGTPQEAQIFISLLNSQDE